MSDIFNEHSLDTLCAALAYALGIDPPAQANIANPELTAYIDHAFAGKKADRLFLYNPDAIAQWIFEKYPDLFRELTSVTDLQLQLRTVMPSVTPVCFGTFYTGAQPEVHGIRSYTKPVIKIDTLFDALIRAGKRIALVTTDVCSMSKIYLERDMDYFNYPDIAEANAKTAELILADNYDVIVLYNGNYDTIMHRYGPESIHALGELRINIQAYAMFDALISEHWKTHRTLMGFAMDHGCHEIDGNVGSHGLDMPEDLNITHFYQAKIGSNTV